MNSNCAIKKPIRPDPDITSSDACAVIGHDPTHSQSDHVINDVDDIIYGDLNDIKYD